MQVEELFIIDGCLRGVFHLFFLASVEVLQTFLTLKETVELKLVAKPRL